MDPSWVIRRGNWLDNFEWTPSEESVCILVRNPRRSPGWGDLDGVLVRKHESEFLNEVDGDVVG